MIVRIGTRGSALARTQTEEAAELLRAKGYRTEIVVVRTRGDSDLLSPLSEIGRGAFTDVFTEMLRRGEIDLAVHSAKDLPTDESRDGFFCLPRADARDALVCVSGREITRVGTGSPRRAAAIKKLYPAADVLPVRGNVDTRIQKLLAGEFDALVLAAAGLDRLHISDSRLTVVRLSVKDCVPAACQGIIAVEGALGERIHDESAGRAARIERACQRLLGGGCTGGVGCFFDGMMLYAQKDGVIRTAAYRDDRDIAALAEAFL